MTLARVRRLLADNLQGVAYLMDNSTPEKVAQNAEIVVVSPQDGECVRSPFRGGHGVPCYYDAFVAVRITVPLKALWGATTVAYGIDVVGALSDDPFLQHPATPIPTGTPAPVPTFPVPRPTCGITC